ncbi:MAG: hypothetical protein WBH85_08795 [Thermoanaerobaculia bacterium]
MPVLILVGLLAVSWVPAAGAQTVLDFTDKLDFDRPESWAMKYYASLTLLTGFGAPRVLEPGRIDLDLEGGWVPSLSEAERTVGFNGTKTEDLNRTSVFVRPAVVIGLPRKLSLTLTWVPPVKAFGVEPNLLAVAIGRPVHQARTWRLGLRGYAQYGTLQADFTCPGDVVAAGDNPELNPFNCVEPSNDEHQISALGLEVSWAKEPRGSGRWEPHVGLSANYLDLEFQVDARHSGIVDRTLLVTDGVTLALTAGVTYHAGERWRMVGEAFYSPLEVTRPPSTSTANEGLFNLRALVSYTVHRGSRGTE